MAALARTAEHVAFWHRHTRIGAAVAVLGCAVVIAYSLATLDEPHRVLLLTLAAVTALVSVPALLLVPVEPIVRHPSGALYFYGWELVGIGIVGVLAYLDGGVTSPLVLLVFLLLGHASAYPVSGVLLSGVASAGTYAAVASLSDQGSLGTLVGGVGVIAVTTAICALSAGNHLQAYERQSELRREASERARRDGLTGCLNHQAFHDRLDRVARKASPTAPVSLILLDIDRFKAVNDTLGHLAGDAVLQHVGQTLRQVVRDGDAVGRLGGDEFAVVLDRGGEMDAAAAAERIRASLRQPSSGPFVTVSVGVATTGEPTASETLVAAADAALYEAKRAGRDRVVAAALTAAGSGDPSEVGAPAS